MTNQPDWGGEQSGFDDFEFTFEEVKFGYNEKLDAQSGRNQLRLLVGGTAVLSDGKQLHTDQGWGIGKGWDAVNGGASVAKEDGSELKPLKNPFNYQCGYSRLVRAAIGCGAGEVINQRCQGDPTNLTQAGVWTGLRFRLQRLPQGTMQDAKTGEDVEWSMLLPTEFLGEVGGPSSAAGSTGTTTSTSNGSGSLEDLAKSTDDKMDFLGEAVKKGVDIAEAEKVWDAAHAG